MIGFLHGMLSLLKYHYRYYIYCHIILSMQTVFSSSCLLSNFIASRIYTYNRIIELVYEEYCPCKQTDMLLAQFVFFKHWKSSADWPRHCCLLKAPTLGQILTASRAVITIHLSHFCFSGQWEQTTYRKLQHDWLLFMNWSKGNTCLFM